MTFTTYVDTTLATVPRDRVRFYINDTVVNQGPRPDGRNFSDAEIAFFLSEEDSRVNGAVARAFEVLASEWSSFAVSEKEGEVDWDTKEVADNYRIQATAWRKKPGGGSEVELSGGVVTLERTDAYS
jgi:hypothetical protein